jgi:hypothetical protein
MVRYLLLAALAASSMGLAAQKARPEMELHVDARNVQHGLPQQIRFSLRNMSDHDIHLPEPIPGCSGPDGAVLLLAKVSGQRGRGVPLDQGCTAMGGDPREGVLARERSWVVLRSGGYLERTVDAGRMHLQQLGNGSYDVSAEYLPPPFSPDEQRELAKAGIEYPHTKLVSELFVIHKDR